MNQLNRFIKVDFDCNSCGREFNREVAYSYAPSLDQAEGYHTYCSNCVEINKEEVEKSSGTKSALAKKTKDFGLPPTEASENLRSLEIDKRTLRKTNRIHQFNTSVSKEWMERLKSVAYEERLKYVEVLEKALECYERYRKKAVHFDCKETIEIPETCSFREKDHQTNQYTSCDKPLFDKKKQLCRSHNRQVRNKFNEFTKDMSVSSTAAWEMQWEQSGDWRYFWGLGEGGE